MDNEKNNLLKLQHQTIFPEYNKAKGYPSNYATSELELCVLKYGHIKKMQQIKPEEHMNFAMRALTGLSESDLDELSAIDSAELIKIVYKNLNAHIELAKNFLSTEGQTVMINNLEALSK